jgi:flagellar biosynthesis anti-sigma factor FlgM
MSIDKLTSQRATLAYREKPGRATTSVAGATTTQGPQSADATSATPPTATPTTSNGAIIALSPGAQLFSRALAAAQATPEVRADRVAALQAKFAAGADPVNADALAAKMLNEGAH